MKRRFSSASTSPVNELERALALLTEGTHTCVLCKNGQLMTSDRRGIAPLLSWLEQGDCLQNASVADKIIGKAAAMLLILGGAKAVYGQVMTHTARDLLEKAGMETAYGDLVQTIINRKGDGPCPMELAVRDLTEPGLAPQILRKTLQGLQNATGE